MNCPSCASSDIVARGKRNAIYPSGIVTVIGWPIAMLHQLSSPYEYRCNRCGLEFVRRSRIGQVALVLLILFLIVVALALVAFLSLMISAPTAGK